MCPMNIKLLCFAAVSCISFTAYAEKALSNTVETSERQWRSCSLEPNPKIRLACFDTWAQLQDLDNTRTQKNTPLTPESTTATQALPPPAPSLTSATAPSVPKCRNNQFTELSRFWELEPGTDCGTFQFRGYRPISISVVGSNSVNQQPQGEAADHTATSLTPYRRTENRLQLSVRTKLAQGLLTSNSDERLDSLWFGYSQQSYWQLFSPEISRPFRTTDHEPELVYIYPADLQLPGGWRLRYAGLGLNHQSNGQSLPLSRSWNRTYVMAGVEHGNHWRVLAKFWQRIPERASSDDNPNISNFIGRAELQTFWSPNPDNTFGLTVRHSLRSQARGSTKLEWLQTLGKGWSKSIGSGQSDLRLHTQIFSGYGDSLVDYNRRRTVFSVGLSLVDF